MSRRIKQKIDFLRSIEYEINLEELRKKRIKRLGKNYLFVYETLSHSIQVTISTLKKRTFSILELSVSIVCSREPQLDSLGISSYGYNILTLLKRMIPTIFSLVYLSSKFCIYICICQNYSSGFRAIQYHPMNPSLWIMAASWEHEHNSNIAAARTLMQRAIRLMPENQLLWHEYFRLELIYIEKIKLRRRILGIAEQSDEQKDIEAMEVDAKEEDSIQLPALTGEDVDSWKEDRGESTKFKLSAEEAKSLEEANNPILKGLLSRIIYDNAIQGKRKIYIAPFCKLICFY